MSNFSAIDDSFNTLWKGHCGEITGELYSIEIADLDRLLIKIVQGSMAVERERLKETLMNKVDNLLKEGN